MVALAIASPPAAQGAASAGRAASAAAAGARSPAPDLDAVVRYETRRLLPSGVSRVEVWRERLVRRGDTVWTERLGATHAHAAPDAAEGHRHFDADAASRLLGRDAEGRTQLRYVDAARRLVVAVPPAEWDAVGFDGRHDAAAHLVPPALVERMAPERGGAAPSPSARGDAWRVQKTDGWTHRVLWSPRRQVALRIESRSDDGRSSRSVAALPQAAVPAAALPWRGIEGYAQREYGDFMD